jgi:RND family efflux transporter MFP subunit
MKIKTVLSILVLTFFLISCGSKEEKTVEKVIRPVKAMYVNGDESGLGLGYPGVTKANQEAEISFRVSGPIVALNVIEGAMVKKGQLIAEIDPRDYQVELQSAQARYNQAKVEKERYYNLWKKGSVAKNDYDRKYANFKEAESNLQTAKNNLKDTKVYAPFTGYYGPKLAEKGDVVQAKQAITTIVDLSRIEVVTTIPERLAVKFNDFESYKIKFDAYPDTVFAASLKNIEKKPTAEGYPLHLYLEHKQTVKNKNQKKVTAGMSCRVNIFLKTVKKENAEDEDIIVPVAAVFEGEADNVPSVWIIDKKTMTVKKQNIVLGSLVGKDRIQIKSGLKAGQLIVTAGSKRLVEGEQIKILDQANFN